MIPRVLLAVSLAGLVFASADAQVLAPQYPQGYRPDFDEEKPWDEQQAALPPYPIAENLIKVPVSATRAFEFFVDPDSVGIGKDGVVRYTLVARSSGGAMNVSFEGIRCAARERKLYAFGRQDRTWAPARKPEWVQISATEANPQHAVLADEFFCPPRSAGEIVWALKHGHPRAGSVDLQNQPR